MAKSEIIEKENCRRVLRVDVAPDEVKAEFEKAYKGISKDASIAGFRKGKAPLTIVRTRYADLAREEVRKNLVISSLHEAIKEKKLEVISEPLVEEGELKPEQGFSYKVTLEVRPEIKLGDYHKFKVAKTTKKVAPEDVDEALKGLQERFSRYITVENKDLSPQDYALVDIKITDSGKKAMDREGIIIYIDDGGFSKGFSEKVTGLKKGEEREFILKFPVKEGTETTEREMNCWLRLKEIKEKRLPLVDDELAKDAGFNKLEELKADIQGRLEEDQERRVYYDMRRQIDEKLLKIGEIAPPESVVKKREEVLVEEFRHNMEMEGRHDEYKEKEGEFRKNVYENNIKRIKLAYILDEIGRREKIEVSREEVEDELKTVFGNNNELLRKARDKLTREEAWEDYAIRVREKKIYRYLIENADVETVVVDNRNQEEG